MTEQTRRIGSPRSAMKTGTQDNSRKGAVLATKRKLPDALRENADRLKRREPLHKAKPRTPQKPKIRTAKSRKGG